MSEAEKSNVSETVKEISNKALGYFRRGDFQQAAKLQEQVCQHPKMTLLDGKRLALYTINAGNFAHGLKVLKALDQKFPNHNDSEIPDSIALCLIRMNRLEDAIAPFKRAAKLAPKKANTHDGLAELYGKLGQKRLSRRHGQTAILIKAEESKQPPLLDLSTVPIPKFNPTTRKKNIISFSLWGNNPLYLQGAQFNVKAAALTYPEWTCRFYMDDSVPAQTRENLEKMGAEIIMMDRPHKPFLGLFWRFLVCNDDTVDRYIIRDADSLVTPREKVVVDEWLKSDKHFHIIRDFFTHTELILAGLWGGVRGALPPLEGMIEEFLARVQPNRTVDQQFTRAHIWPTVKTSALIHDSQHRLNSTTPFPKDAPRPEGKHVGQRFDVYLNVKKSPAK